MMRPDQSARYEHAMMLRAEGCKLREIAKRLGVSQERARQMILKAGHILASAMKRTRVTIS